MKDLWLKEFQIMFVLQVTKILTSADFADKIRKMIWDNATHSTPYYGPVFNHKLKTSTAHLSLLGDDGIAVAVTSTVNLLWDQDLIFY